MRKRAVRRKANPAAIPPEEPAVKKEKKRYPASIPPLEEPGEYRPPEHFLGTVMLYEYSHNNNCDEWDDREKHKFRLALHAFGKNFVMVKKFVQTKTLGQVLFHYYTEFRTADHAWRQRRKCKPSRVSHLSPREIFEILTHSEIFEILSQRSRFRLRGRIRVFGDIFWYAVWPRLLAAGWSAEKKHEKKHGNSTFLVFRNPEGKECFNSLIVGLRMVVSKPSLLGIEEASLGKRKIDEDACTSESKRKLQFVNFTLDGISVALGEASSSKAVLACSALTIYSKENAINSKENTGGSLSEMLTHSETDSSAGLSHEEAEPEVDLELRLWPI